MAKINIAPTKSNQLSLKRDLDMATEGFTLLEQKREILVMELMRLLNKVKQTHQKMSESRKKAYITLRLAIAQNGHDRMRNIASGIHFNHEVKTGTRVSAGIRLPVIHATEGEFKSQFSFVGTNSLVDQTMVDFLNVLKFAAEMAELESSVWLLARELKKTQRRVNALEHIFIPNFKETLHYIGESLEGAELDSIFTMKLVKKRLEEKNEESNDME